MRKNKKGFLLIIFLIIVTAPVLYGYVQFLWMGGYWENMSLFNHISGPKRFKQFVVDPIPSYIADLRGGYSGFPQGQITTYFSFEKDSMTWPFLKDWVESSNPTEERVSVVFGKEITFSRVYKHREKDYYLAIDENSGKGLLYVP